MRTFALGLVLVLAACSNRSTSDLSDLGSNPPPASCGDMGGTPNPSFNHECMGKRGCQQIAPTCGCHCALCENEVCLAVLCDDSCQPGPCPVAKPEEGTSCTSTPSRCEYLIESCPCGPSDVVWTCACEKGGWRCGRGYDCYPCGDGRRDGGFDAKPLDAKHLDVKPLDVKLTTDGSCAAPSFSTDCSKVTEFQCGFSAACAGDEVTASWHHHSFCNGMEEITSYTCTTKCASTCVAGSAWPKDGTELVQQYCK